MKEFLANVDRNITETDAKQLISPTEYFLNFATDHIDSLAPQSG
ncbi:MULTISPECIES: hypothetical protein [Microcoleaceae]|nr:hypothetical protein [Tychonema sp. LEGE 06208]